LLYLIKIKLNNLILYYCEKYFNTHYYVHFLVIIANTRWASSISDDLLDGEIMRRNQFRWDIKENIFAAQFENEEQLDLVIDALLR
jgi:hypothetical protein